MHHGLRGGWTPLVACALRRETPIQYPCCSRERPWVVEDLKGRYRNGRNEYKQAFCGLFMLPLSYCPDIYSYHPKISGTSRTKWVPVLLGAPQSSILGLLHFILLIAECWYYFIKSADYVQAHGPPSAQPILAICRHIHFLSSINTCYGLCLWMTLSQFLQNLARLVWNLVAINSRKLTVCFLLKTSTNLLSLLV